MANIVGIDLGTTNSCIAALDPSGRAKVIHNSEGSNITPSAVYVEPGAGNKVAVGMPAQNAALFDSERVLRSFKRDMATARVKKVDDQTFTPTQLSAFVLKKLIDDAVASVGVIKKVVITVPANFPNEARTATIEAGKLAGVEVTNIINEPTAALFCYSLERPIEGKVVVYDFGGGTLDVTIAEVRGKDVEIVTSAGDSKLGGIDCDAALEKLVANKFKQQTSEEYDSRRHQATPTFEELKKNLTTLEKATVTLSGGSGGRVSIQVARGEFEKAISTLMAKSDLLVDTVLSQAQLKASDVSSIFLVGGSSRMPVVKRQLTRLFGKEPVASINPDEVVALGAALYAGFRAGASELNAAQATAMRSMKLQEVCNHYFGTISISYDEAAQRKELQNSIIIDKNSKLPCSKTESYLTIHDDQRTVHCQVTQSATKESDPDFVRIIWDGDLGPFPAGRPRGQEIKITFSYDLNQIMHCSFEDVGTGLKREVKLGLAAGAEEQSIDQFLVE